MASLTKAQIAFLKTQNISLSQIFDATGLTKEQRLLMMDRLEVPFYYGGAACKAAGHTLRTKAGHCIQCDTSKIAYQLRHSASGFVYLAHSPDKKYVKVGYSKRHPQERVDFLCTAGYGNAKDWSLKKVVKLDKDAGKMEFLIHSSLESYLKPVIYEKGIGQHVECREIFSCELQQAMKIFDDATNN